MADYTCPHCRKDFETDEELTSEPLRVRCPHCEKTPELAAAKRVVLHLPASAKVIVLPEEGSLEADALVDACTARVYYAQPWPDGTPPATYEAARITMFDEILVMKELVLMVLTAAIEKTEEGGK